MATLARRLSRTKETSVDVLALIAEGLVAKIPALKVEMQAEIAAALHDLLDGCDELSRLARVGMQHHLIQVAEDLLQNTESKVIDKMLTTEQAATLMHCSRPYVAMLVDNKKLAGATITEGGHRRVPESSVRAWIKSKEEQAAGVDYRAAGVEAGMYEIPEQTYVDVADKA
jgi:excisionase family DNA binding protein